MCWNKQAKLKYKPNGCIDYSMKSIIMAWQYFFMCVHCGCVFEHACLLESGAECICSVSQGTIIAVAQTYDGARDSTQTLRSRLS